MIFNQISGIHVTIISEHNNSCIQPLSVNKFCKLYQYLSAKHNFSN